MVVCTNCGEENPERFRLCGFCGTPLAKSLPVHEVRKTVTIVFSDLKGSTSLGEQLDSESLREVLTRYFDVMRAVLEEHGGTVEKYIGDAIMAVFGLPTLHEDDALRAVRAAAGMQAALDVLNDELERGWGVRLTNRTGVNTGEVVAGDPLEGQRLVTGDAVNVAARLEQAAPALDVLLGETTYRLVRDAVEVEEVEPLELKGKSERVPAYRLVRVRAPHEADARLAAPLVGRADELDSLLGCLAATIERRSASLVTVIGDAGVGKTRLLEELTARVAPDARALRGRCLSYGRGITFWPLVEMVKGAAAIGEDEAPDAARARILALVGGDRDVAERVAAAVGLSTAQFSREELFWGARKLFEHLASERPLVLVVEDVHWAETTFLDLLETVVDGLDGAPVLVVAAARHELSELRPAWTERYGRIELGALSAVDCVDAAVDILAGGRLADGVRDRVAAAADGNPLFARQLLSMLVEEGRLVRAGDEWVVATALEDVGIPPTLHALLAARLDLLTREERAVIEAASVIGTVFARAAVAELVPDVVRAGVDGHLDALVRRNLVVDQAAAGGDETFRFHHALIRDEAYRGLLKRSRATLHERFADWAERVNAERDRALEYEEILGYHLEQAYRYLAELGPLDAKGQSLGARAADRLSSAGRRAFARSDMAAAANLLRRAAMLLPEREPSRLALLPDLAEALVETGELPWADLFLTQALEGAQAVGDERLEAEAKLGLLLQRRYAERHDRWTSMLLEEAERAVAVFERAGYDGALARTWRLVMNAHGVARRFGDAAAAAERAAEHARRAGDARQEARAASGYAMAALYGPTPVAEAIRHCEQSLANARGDKRLTGLLLCLLAPLHAMRGDFGVAREHYDRGRALLEEIGDRMIAASATFNAAKVDLLAGEPAAAEARLQRELDALTAMGETYLRSTVAAYLAAVACAEGRFEDAETYATLAADLASDDDVISQSLWRQARARVLAQDGRYEEAVELARQAVELLRSGDGIGDQADALVALSEVLALAGRTADAESPLAEALALYERKGNVAAAAAARAGRSTLAVASRLS